MRTGLTISVIGHALVLAWGLFSLPSARPFQIEPMESLPVDILSDAEFTKLTKGSKKAPLRPDPSPADKTEAKKAPEAENPGKHEIDKPSPKPEEKKTAALPPANQPPPPPKAVEKPKPPEPKPAEETPPPVEKKVEPAPAPEKAPEPAPEAEKAPEPLPADAPKPRAKPTPPKKEAVAKPAEQQSKPTPQTADNKKKDFDPNDISALLNKVDPSGGGAKSGEKQASLGSPTGRAEKLTAGELDALRGQIARCWNPPVGAVGSEALIVEIQMQLNEDGSLAGSPSVVNSSSSPFFRAAADAAIRAVRRCAPYDLPAAKFETWKDVKVNFDPRQMMGGW